MAWAFVALRSLIMESPWSHEGLDHVAATVCAELALVLINKSCRCLAPRLTSLDDAATAVTIRSHVLAQEAAYAEVFHGSTFLELTQLYLDYFDETGPPQPVLPSHDAFLAIIFNLHFWVKGLTEKDGEWAPDAGESNGGDDSGGDDDESDSKGS